MEVLMVLIGLCCVFQATFLRLLGFLIGLSENLTNRSSNGRQISMEGSLPAAAAAATTIYISKCLRIFWSTFGVLVRQQLVPVGLGCLNPTCTENMTQNPPQHSRIRQQTISSGMDSLKVQNLKTIASIGHIFWDKITSGAFKLGCSSQFFIFQTLSWVLHIPPSLASWFKKKRFSWRFISILVWDSAHTHIDV